MAIGFRPKHIEDYVLDNLTQQQFLVLAKETAIKLGWNVSYLSDTGIICYTDNGFFSWNAEIKIKTENGLANIQSASTGNEMMDWGKNKKNVAEFIAALNELKSSIAIEELDIKYQEMKEQLVSPEEDILKLPPATKVEQFSNFFSIFKPTQGFFITPILLDLNILIFIIMALSGVNLLMPDNQSLLNWGANFRPMTLEGEWWRLLTCCFIHIGMIHLLMNMYALLYIGVLLEPHLGRTRFIAAYLLTGIIASVVSLWWHDFTISAGASGAIFGMYGVFLAMLTTNLIEKTERKALLTSIAVFVGYNLLNGLKSGIDNAAHLGGLLGGLVVGYAFIPSLKKPDETKLKLGIISVLSIVIIILSFTIYKRLPNDLSAYDEKIKTFASMESMALEVYSLPSNTPKDKLLYSIKDRGIYYWNENLKLLASLEELNLPLEIRTQNRLLREYCELRLQSYELMYKSIDEKTDKYNNIIEVYNQKIEAKLNEITALQ